MTDLTWILARNRVRLFDEIHLKANIISVLHSVPWYRDHGQQIHKRLSSLAIVDETKLDFFSSADLVLQRQNRTVIDILPPHPRLYVSVRALKETTISAQNFQIRIACKPLEDVRAVDDRHVMQTDIAHDKCAR